MHGRDGFQPGDVLIMNHPYVCGQHLNNVVVYTPSFIKGSWWLFCRARTLDRHRRHTGWIRLQRHARIGEEGLQFRSLKLYRGSEPNQDIFQIITDNVRFAESCLGDLRAQPPPAASAIVVSPTLSIVTVWKPSCAALEPSGINLRHWRVNMLRA